MIDNIASTMKKLENIVIDCYSESDKSETLSERQQQRLEILKQRREDDRHKRRCNRNEKRASGDARDMRKRGTDATRLKQNDKSTKVKNYDVEVWHACATKAVDSERERKRHEDKGQIQRIET